MRILIIEDHVDLAENLGDYLEDLGHSVDFAGDGLTGLHLAVVNPYDALVLDLMLPGVDGLELAKRLRRDAGDDVPILMLTARDTLEDKLAGFEAGSDDYVVKPFALQELAARLEAVTRRGKARRRHLRVGDLRLDLGTRVALRQGRRLSLNPTGFRLLRALMAASPDVVPRAELEATLWGDEPPDSDALRTHIYLLRQALDGPFERPLLQTVHSVGYRLADDAAP